VYSSLLGQLIFTGVDAIAMISFLAVLAGIGVTSQLIYIMHAITGASEKVHRFKTIQKSSSAKFVSKVYLLRL
jgi:phospholipid/cholesterol/gamma-HCH transport system permease protein